jgi:hypothetical protein
MINNASKQTRFGTPDNGKGAQYRPAKGRLCQEPGCETLLSTYNASDRCYLHSAPAFRHALYRD